MTTAGNNGVPESPEGGAPQDDDPFGYLYRPADGGSGQPAEPQQGVPRTPYSRPMEVGRAQYGQSHQAHQPYGQPQQQPYPAQQRPPYGGPQPGHGADAPTQQARYAEHSRPQPGEERSGGGRSKGAVIGAVAVVAAIAIGAGIALSKGDPDADAKAKAATTSSAAPAPTSAPATGPASPTASASAALPGTVDAAQLQGQNAPTGNTVKGAKSADGSYLTLQAGSSVTWSGDLPAAGTYKFSVHFNNPGGSVKGSVAVNGKDRDGGIEFKNYAPGNEAANSWYTTYILPQLQAGPNTVTITVPGGAGGSVLVDQITVTGG